MRMMRGISADRLLRDDLRDFKRLSRLVQCFYVVTQ